ncbi:MAG: DUF2867 domain-containing protein [Flavobacteriales bacterium]|nr:DUF2867 domain-containing protein [Flavobacteriales bacterium]
MKVIEVTLDDNYLIAKRSKDIDYLDVFQMETTSFDKPIAPKDCMIAFFKSFPSFFTKMLLFRESVARFIGLKTAPKTSEEEREKKINEFQGDVGDSIAIFEVLDRNETELLTGQKDKHLDFLFSFISYQKENNHIIELATTVVIHNFLGRVYFFFVRPVHRIYMKRIMKRMVKELLKTKA